MNQSRICWLAVIGAIAAFLLHKPMKRRVMNEYADEEAAIKRKYADERAKRLRVDGNQQFIAPTEDLEGFTAEKGAPITTKRDPHMDETDVVIVGGGFGGLLAGTRLRQKGVNDIRIIDRGSDFGGTWYWNKYPGCRCDTDALTYLPLLEELNYTPSEKYVTASEIAEHCRRIGKSFDLYSKAIFQTTVTSITWNDASGRWTILTNRGDDIKARFVIASPGPFDRLKLPGITGINSFKGKQFHTNRWDYNFTGGSPTEKLVGLSDKRVAIIGSGATAVQVVPPVADAAQHLYVFQRTPSTIDARNNEKLDAGMINKMPPGWQKQRRTAFEKLIMGTPGKDNIEDGWTSLAKLAKEMFLRTQSPLCIIRKDWYLRVMEKMGICSPSEELFTIVNMEKMRRIRAHIQGIVDDKDVAEKLKPWYYYFCKRPCFSDTYLQAFNRSNVNLIDTDGKGVEKITEKGLMVQGKEIEVDVIIYATGFEIGTGFERIAGFKIIGRDGRSLTEKWGVGKRTLHGMHSNGYPNLCLMNQYQATYTTNFAFMLDEFAEHASYIIAHALQNNIDTFEATAEAENEWVKLIVRKNLESGKDSFDALCTPGYYTAEGTTYKGDDDPRRQVFACPSSEEFFQTMKEWRYTGNFEGLSFTPSRLRGN